MTRNVFLLAGLTLLGIVLATVGPTTPAFAQAADCRAPGVDQYRDCGIETVTAVPPSGPGPQADRPGPGAAGTTTVDVESDDAFGAEAADAGAAVGQRSTATSTSSASASAGVPTASSPIGSAEPASGDAGASVLPETGGVSPTLPLLAGALLLVTGVLAGRWALRRE